MLALLVFPWTQFGFGQVTCQHQMIVDNSHDLAPTIELLRCSQSWFSPKQGLFPKAIAVFLSKTQDIEQGHESHSAFRLLSLIDKPTDSRVTLTVRGLGTDHLNNCQI